MFGSTSPVEESFVHVAPYYDELMKGVPYRMWVSYYLLLLAHQQVHPKSILDVCCGTGTMCEMLTSEGFVMSGFDLSDAMITEAKKKAAKRKLAIDYTAANAANFNLGVKFDAALSFFDSLNNLLDPSDLESAFRSVALHLHPGGSWIFDLNTAYAFETDLFNQEHLRANSKLKYKWIGNYDPETQIIKVDMDFWYREEAFHETHRQRAYEEIQVREMLTRAGFVNIRTFHSYTLNPVRPKSDRIHYLARLG